MSVQAVSSSQYAAQAEAVSAAQAAQKQLNQSQTTQQSAIPQDRVTISAAAQAKQTAASIGADPDHDGK